MEVVFPLHAAWVWNNYFFSLSHSSPLFLFPLFVFAVLWRSSTLVLGLCTTPFAPPPLHPTTLLPLSVSLPFPSSLSVVYQDGFYGAADLYVSKLTSHRHALSVPPLTAFSCSFSSGGDSACASSHALHRAACIKVNEPTMKNCFETQSTTCDKLTQHASMVFLPQDCFICDKNVHNLNTACVKIVWFKNLIESREILIIGQRVSNTTIKAALWAGAVARVSVRVCERMNKSVCACIQVDNGCFCSLYRLVFQDSVLSPRLPQVGSSQHQTHSVHCFTVLPPLILWIIFWSDLEHVFF